MRRRRRCTNQRLASFPRLYAGNTHYCQLKISGRHILYVVSFSYSYCINDAKTLLRNNVNALMLFVTFDKENKEI